MAQEKQQNVTEQPKTTPVEPSTEVKASEASETGEQQAEKGKETGIEPSEAKPTQIQRPARGGLGRAELFTSPLSFMQRMMDEMDRMFSRFGGGLAVPGLFELARENIWSPAIETFERDGRLVLRADLPGLERGDVKVEVEGDELVISGERKEVKRETTKGRYYSERHYGTFERRLALPVDLKPEDIEASFENGVLEISFAVPEEKPKTRTIEVKSGRTEGGGPRSVH